MDSNSDFFNQEEFEWAKIPESNFLIKYKFFENELIVLVSNLKELFEEKLDEEKIQQRFSNDNPHAEMKTRVIFKNLKQALETALKNKELNIVVDYSNQNLNIQLQFFVNQVSFIFHLKPVLLTNEKLQEQIVTPVLTHALLTQQENAMLKKRVQELESKLTSTLSPQKSLLNGRMNSSFFGLFEKNVSETVLLDAFLEIQNGIKDCLSERKKVFELYQKQHSQSSNQQQSSLKNGPVKREITELLNPDIKYEDNACEDTIEHHIKKEENEDSLTVSENVKTKKKKTLRF